MRCEKCQFECDREDAFCRKCGAALAHEASFNELEAAQSGSDSTVAATAVEVVTPVALAPAKPGPLSRLSQALQSERGKKLVRGATLVAVGVGIELAAQALGKRGQPQTGLARRPEAMPHFPEEVGKAPSFSEPVVLESVTFQRIYTRTIIRRVK